MLKVGVLTFHRCINYGSYWQARCLVEGLRERGYDAALLDHRSRRVDIAEWKCAFRPVLPTAVPASDHPLYRRKIRRFFEAFGSLTLSPPFPIDSPAEMMHCDTVVVGSDEVWNLSHPWYGRFGLFYSEGLRARRLVSYAASFGSYHAINGLPQKWAKKLENFSMVSVRDRNSQTIIRKALGIEPEVVLDPCLQFSIVPEKRQHATLEQPYVAVYGHNFTAAFIRRIRQWARRQGLRLISIGYRNNWADGQWIDADPHDFAHFMAGSRAVATNFFHGCVFSLCYRKPFACQASPYRSNKLHDLMATVNSRQHLVTDTTPRAHFQRLLSRPLPQATTQRIARLREVSGRYLSRALKVKENENVSYV